MSKTELKNEFIKLYNSMSKKRKRCLDIEADGLLSILDYAAETDREDLCDAFDELTEEKQDEILDEIGELYYNEFAD